MTASRARDLYSTASFSFSELTLYKALGEDGKEAKVIPVTDIIKLGDAASGSKITSVKAYKRSNKTI